MVVVEIIKVHSQFEEVFPLGSVAYFRNEKPKATITNTDGVIYHAEDLTKCFSNYCPFSEVFKRI